MRFLLVTLSALLTVGLSATAQAFCGFYVAKADTSLFNRASQVVLVRDGDRTVIWPVGTWKMVRLHGVAQDPPPQ